MIETKTDNIVFLEDEKSDPVDSQAEKTQSMSSNILNDLLSRCALHDQKALEELYKQSSPRLYALALKLLSKPEWAEDVLQESFIKIWRNAASYQVEKSSAMTWMSTVVRNTALDKLRELKREPLFFEEFVELRSNAEVTDLNGRPHDLTDVDQEMDRLSQCLQKLHEEQKEALLMSYYHGYSHQELSSKLTKPLGTVKGWIRRGLEHLRGCLGK